MRRRSKNCPATEGEGGEARAPLQNARNQLAREVTIVADCMKKLIMLGMIC